MQPAYLRYILPASQPPDFLSLAAMTSWIGLGVYFELLFVITVLQVVICCW